MVGMGPLSTSTKSMQMYEQGLVSHVNYGEVRRGPAACGRAGVAWRMVLWARKRR